MEIVYLIAGKRFKPKSAEPNALNYVLAPYNLVMSKDKVGEGCSVDNIRRKSDPSGTSRYDIFSSYGEAGDPKIADFCIGKVIGNTGYGDLPEVVETEISELEQALNEVKQDIPDAKVLAFSHWS